MTSTHFTTGTTITSEWLNDVNDAVYEGNITAEGVQYTPPFTGGVTETVEAKLAQTVSVKDFGAVGDGVTDDTAAIQDAANYLDTVNGGGLFFPSGAYLFSSTVFLPSNTKVFGAGQSSILKAVTGTAWTINTIGTSTYTLGSFRALFTNKNFLSDTILDENYLFCDFYADLDLESAVQRKALVSFISVKNVECHSITTFGGGSVISNVHTENTNIHDCVFLEHGGSAADHYSGFVNAQVCNNYFKHKLGTSSNPAIQFTGTNNDNTTNTSSGFICIGNRIDLISGGELGNIFELCGTASGAGGIVNDVLIFGNVINCNNQVGSISGAGVGGIGFYGGGTNIVIQSNIVKNVTIRSPIQVFDNGYGVIDQVYISNNKISNCSSTAAVVTIADNATILDNDVTDCTVTTIFTSSGSDCILRWSNINSTYTNIYTAVGSLTVETQVTGTWTPTLNFGGATTGITYSTRSGTWLKQGNMIYIEVALVLTNKGSATGNATITGLPFTATALIPLLNRLNVSQVLNTVSITEEPVLRASGVTITMVNSTVSGVNLTDGNFANNTNLYFCGWYRTS